MKMLTDHNIANFIYCLFLSQLSGEEHETCLHCTDAIL